jgi:hypothetical protein
MVKALKNNFNRRSMFRSVLRYTTLGLLGGGIGFEYFKRRKLLHQGKCVNDKVCSQCGVFDRCGRPEALSAKKVLEGELDG